MNDKAFKRRLAAILGADVAGYGRLMGEDDAATVRTLTGHRKLISKIIQRHEDRVIDSPGDNLLAEFERPCTHRRVRGCNPARIG